MRRRLWPIKDTAAAVLYIDRLLKYGIEFRVKPMTDRVDIETPFDLEAEAWPEIDWIKGARI